MTQEESNPNAESETPPNPWKQVGHILEDGTRSHGNLEEHYTYLRSVGKRVRLLLVEHE